MKKNLLIIATCILFAGNVIAQNSAVEAALQFETKAEKFIKACDFYKTTTYSDMEEDGLKIYAQVFENLKNHKKLGAIYFETESDKAKAAMMAVLTGGATSADDGSPKPLGYLDIDEVDDLLSALNAIVAETKVKSKEKFTISYMTHGGINVVYNKDNNECRYFKEWNTVNKYGTRVQYVVYSKAVSIKAVTKTITMLEKAKTIINQNL